MNYTIGTRKEVNRFGKAFYYPVVSFYCRATGQQELYLNTPQLTRGKARTIAKNYVKNNKE